MSFARRTLIVLLLIAVFLTSCGAQSPASATPDVNAILTAAVGTFAASIFQTQTAFALSVTPTITPTASPTSTPFTLLSPTAPPTQLILYGTPIATYALLPTVTGTQYTPTANPSTLGNGCNNLRLIRDVTIPAGTVFKPNETFTKTWQVENNGTCNWVYLYRLVFVSGNAMGGEPASLGKIIVPGKWTQLSVNLEAPKQPGTYTGYWRFGDQSGNMFGSTLGVSIVVKASSYP